MIFWGMISKSYVHCVQNLHGQEPYKYISVANMKWSEIFGKIIANALVSFHTKFDHAWHKMENTFACSYFREFLLVFIYFFICPWCSSHIIHLQEVMPRRRHSQQQHLTLLLVASWLLSVPWWMSSLMRTYPLSWMPWRSRTAAQGLSWRWRSTWVGTYVC